MLPHWASWTAFYSRGFNTAGVICFICPVYFPKYVALRYLCSGSATWTRRNGRRCSTPRSWRITSRPRLFTSPVRRSKTSESRKVATTELFMRLTVSESESMCLVTARHTSLFQCCNVHVRFALSEDTPSVIISTSSEPSVSKVHDSYISCPSIIANVIFTYISNSQVVVSADLCASGVWPHQRIRHPHLHRRIPRSEQR